MQYTKTDIDILLAKALVCSELPDASLITQVKNSIEKRIANFDKTRNQLQ